MSDDRYSRRRDRRDRRREFYPNTPPPPQDSEEMSSENFEMKIRQRVEERIAKRTGFYIHLVSFIAVNSVLWLIWVSSDGRDFPPWPIYVTFFWGFGLVANGISVYQDSERAINRREEMIQDEIAREKQRMGLANPMYEKPKRDQAMRLGDDGELLPA